jgi:hypothetical protein
LDVCFKDVLAQLTTESIPGKPTQEMRVSTKLA